MPSSSKKNALLARFFYGPAKKMAMWDHCITVFSWQQWLIDNAVFLCCTRFNMRYIQKWNIDTWRQYSAKHLWNWLWRESVTVVQIICYKLFCCAYHCCHFSFLTLMLFQLLYVYTPLFKRDMLTHFWIYLDLYLFIFMVMTLYLLWCPLRCIVSV